MSTSKFKKQGNSNHKSAGVKLEMNDKTLKLFRHFVDPTINDKKNKNGDDRKNPTALMGPDG